jgi:hypothetical protein
MRHGWEIPPSKTAQARSIAAGEKPIFSIERVATGEGAKQFEFLDNLTLLTRFPGANLNS